MKPWEKYSQSTGKPWEKYGAQSEAAQDEATDQKTQQPSTDGIGKRLNREISDIPRQLGLTGRHVLEGIGDMADLVASPVRAGLNAAGMNIQGRSGKDLSDILGLPEPRNPTERVVGDISRLVVSSGTGIGLAGKLAQGSTGVTQKVLKAISNRPDLQLASATGAGAAGGIVRETGGDPFSQAVSSLIGGLVAPVATSGVQKAAGATRLLTDRLRGSPNLSAKIDVVINEAVKPVGISLSDIPASIKAQLHKDMTKAVQTGAMTPDVARRLVDYRMTGLTPTAGPLTLDPGAVTRQKNLAALGVSTQDPKLQALSNIENANARKLIENINQLGAGTADDTLAAGQKVISAIEARNAAEQAKIGSLYDAAKDSAGRSALLDGKAFGKYALSSLKENLRTDFLPANVRNKLMKLAAGKETLTVDKAEVLKTIIGQMQAGSTDGNARYALGLVRKALDNTPLIGTAGEGAKAAFGAARAANKSWMQTVENTPALAAIRDGVEPDKFVQTFIVGKGNAASVGSVSKLRDLIKDVPEAMTAIKNNVAKMLKSQALGGKSDELAKFSSTAYNKALNSIGDAKLSMFFSPQEVQALKAIGRVASYEQFQPTGSAVNNSRTAAALVANVLDTIGGNIVSSKLSGGILPGAAKVLSDPLRSSSASIEAGRMIGVPATIMKRPANDPMFLLPPALYPFIMENQ